MLRKSRFIADDVPKRAGNLVCFTQDKQNARWIAKYRLSSYDLDLQVPSPPLPSRVSSRAISLYLRETPFLKAPLDRSRRRSRSTRNEKSVRHLECDTQGALLGCAPSRGVEARWTGKGHETTGRRREPNTISVSFEHAPVVTRDGIKSDTCLRIEIKISTWISKVKMFIQRISNLQCVRFLQGG